MTALERLAATVREEGGLVGTIVRERVDVAPVLGPLAARGARARGHADPDAIALIVEAVHEGYLLHYGASRLLATEDRDLALLAGDRLYALGLARLAELGDVAAVAELADVIALCAQAHAAGDRELAQAVWEAGAVAVGWGADPALVQAKATARAGAPGAAAALRAAARQVAGDVAPHS